MSKAEPTIQKFMTIAPFFVDAGQSMQFASELMAKNKIRHLPVMNDGKVAGIVSDRDLKLAAGIEGVDPDKILAIDVCHENPYMVDPDVPLSKVVSTMAEHAYGSAIIIQNGKLVGIFTTVDACRALSDILQTRFHTH